MNWPDPDKLVEGDPPINAASMLEVLGESREEFQRRIDAARDMMVPYAIRALLDGADPFEVARACGFCGATRENEDHLKTIQDSIFEQMGYALGPWGGVQIQQKDGLEAFAIWIGDKLTEMIKEKM